jgi:4-aminobutyrate aminotransferase-like enzyme
VIPGPRSKRLIRRLRRVEIPHITYADADFPVFWEKASGCEVTDADGNRFLDITSAFGVSSLGHASPVLQRAIGRQSRKMWHGMGDVHPPVAKVHCLEVLRTFLPRKLTHVILSSSGSEAVESALKTAYVATGKPGVIAFEGAYHGLGYGALQVTHRAFFREPFVHQCVMPVHFEPYILEGTASAAEIEKKLDALRRTVRSAPRARAFGAIIVEPQQGRGGVRIMDPRYLRGLKRLADAEHLILIFDEIFTGFGRTGKWFACDHAGVAPDVMTLGTAMSTGFPISACAMSTKLMKAWGASPGDAKHTSTYLGNPLGCAMVIETLSALKAMNAPARTARLGRHLKKRLDALRRDFPGLVKDVRGRGLMFGIEMRNPRHAGRIMKALLKRKIISLTSGSHAEVLGFTPPFVIRTSEIDRAVREVRRALAGLHG